MRRTITPPGAPTGRPYSPGVMVGQTLYISGQLGLPGSGATPAAMDVQARQAMDGVGAVLKAAGLGFEHLVKCNVYLANMDDYAAMNAAYASYFTGPRARADHGAGGGAALERRHRGVVHRLCGPRRHLGRASAGRLVADAAGAVLAGGLGRRHAVPLWHGRTGSGDQDGERRGRGQVTQTVANVTTTLKAAGLGLADAVSVQAYATRGDEATALASSLTDALGRTQRGSPARGLVVLPRLPGPIRAELTFVAVKPAVARRTAMQQMNDVFAESTQVGPVLYAAPRAGATGEDVDVAGTGGVQGAAAEREHGRIRLARRRRRPCVPERHRRPAARQCGVRRTVPDRPPARVTIQVHPQGKERIRVGLIAAR